MESLIKIGPLIHLGCRDDTQTDRHTYIHIHIHIIVHIHIHTYRGTNTFTLARTHTHSQALTRTHTHTIHTHPWGRLQHIQEKILSIRRVYCLPELRTILEKKNS